MNSKPATIIALLVVGLVVHSASADTSIPAWIKGNAKMWANGQIGDDEFVKGIQYLIQKNVIQMSDSTKTVEKSSQIPSWIKSDADWWASGSIGDGEFISAMQYLIGSGIINPGTQTDNQSSLSSDATTAMTENVNIVNSNVTTTSSDSDVVQCDFAVTAADKQTCLNDIAIQKDLKEKMASATPFVVGPVTYYLVGADGINTGDAEFINVHTILENTGSSSSNPDLFCTGPFACNYHLSDGQNDYPPSIFSLTSGHLELRYQKPVAIDWNFYSKENTGGFAFDPSKPYSFKVSEPFGSATIPLKLNLQ